MENTAVSFTNVTHRYDAKPALNNISFQIPRGSIFGLIGPNGSGKSTTLNILTTMLAHSDGQVHVLGKDVRTEAMEIKKGLGYAPEEVALYDGLSGREFVELSGALHHMDVQTAADRAVAMLDIFGLKERMDDQLGSYSKGMRRKALIASAMVHEPELLVLDEPMEGLDVLAQDLLKTKIRAHAASGKTVIYSTHILEVLEGFCTHVMLLRQGELLGFGPVEEVRAKLGVANLSEVFLKKAGGV